MPIVYRKMIKLFEERGVNSYTIKKAGVIGQETYKKIHRGGHIDTRSLGALCKYLNCQPGDLIEYVEDEPETEEKPEDKDATP